MPIVDKRNDANVYYGGSDRLEVYLEAADAQSVFGASAVAGWYTISYMDGGELGPEIESEDIKSEAGVIVDTRVTTDEFVVTNTVLQSDVETYDLLDLLTDGFRKYRYALPADRDSNESPTAWIVTGVYRGKVDKSNWREATAEGEQRTREFTVRGSKQTDGGAAFVRAKVTSLTDESGWPSDLDTFLTDDTQWPS